jgi:hypothetical protein
MPGSRNRFARGAIAVGLGAALLAGIAVLGSFAAALLGPRDRYRIPLDAIDCPFPPWVDEKTFWAEVRYLGDLPDRFVSTDPQSVATVRGALAKHPWVDFVADDGYLTVGGRFPLTVRFRRPILAVTTAGPVTRTVDVKGVLLPAHDADATVARLLGEFPPPAGPAGATWDHPTIRRAAELAERYDARTLERTDAGWRIVRRSGEPLLLDR